MTDSRPPTTSHSAPPFPVHVAEVTLKFTDPDQTRFALSAARFPNLAHLNSDGSASALRGFEGGSARDGARARQTEGRAGAGSEREHRLRRSCLLPFYARGFFSRLEGRFLELRSETSTGFFGGSTSKKQIGLRTVQTFAS